MIDQFLAAVKTVVGRFARIAGWFLTTPLPWWFYAVMMIGVLAAFDAQM